MNKHYKNYYDQAIGFSIKEIHQVFIEFKDLLENNLICDIGCGNGELEILLAPHAKQIFACDISKKSIVHIRKLSLSERLTNLHLFLGSAENLFYKDEVFDIAFLSEVVEHLPHPENGIKEATRVLKNGGYLFLSCPNYWNLYGFIYWTFEKILGVHLSKQPIEHIITPYKIKKIAEENNLEIKKIVGIGFRMAWFDKAIILLFMQIHFKLYLKVNNAFPDLINRLRKQKEKISFNRENFKDSPVDTNKIFRSFPLNLMAYDIVYVLKKGDFA